MNTSLFATVIIFMLTLVIIICYLLRKERISIKYALIWILTIITSLILLIIPNLLEKLSKLLGFELLSNMVLCVFIVILLLMTIALTVMISDQKKIINHLIQEIGILKKDMEDKK